LALGRTHELINLLALPGFLYFLPKEFYLSFSVGYVLGTFLLSPNLDLKHSALYYLLYFFLSYDWQEDTQKISQLNPLILAEKLAYK